MKRLEVWKQAAKKLKLNIFLIYLAYKDPRVPWYAKVLSVCLVGYAFSPIDLIPDFIPVLGYLDDLVILPLGVLLVLKLIPQDVLIQYKAQAEEKLTAGKPRNWLAAGVIATLWVLTGLIIIDSLISK